MKILLLSHGFLAKELMHTGAFIMEDIDDISYLCLDENGIESFSEKMKQYLNDHQQDEVLFLCDLAHGSPHNQLMINMLEQSLIHYKIITGMNLPMLMQANIAKNAGESLDVIAASCLQAAKEGILSYER